MKSLRYVRFVVAEIDKQSSQRSGLLRALGRLEDELSEVEASRAKAAFKWFNDHLPIPDRFARSGRWHPTSVALSWFKDTATDHIAWMWEVAAILDAHDVKTEMIRTERPGYILYEDEFQITAEPFADTPT